MERVANLEEDLSIKDSEITTLRSKHAMAVAEAEERTRQVLGCFMSNVGPKKYWIITQKFPEFLHEF